MVELRNGYLFVWFWLQLKYRTLANDLTIKRFSYRE